MSCTTFSAVAAVGLVCVLIGSAADGEEIPLAKIHATVKQDGLQRVAGNSRLVDGQRQFDEPYGYDLLQIGQETSGVGASNAFLVRGKDLAGAVKATRWVMTGARSVGSPAVPDPDANEAPLWAVAYLGIGGSTPPAWTLKKVTVEDKTVRVFYEQGQARTRDLVQYWYWIPLDVSEPGVYRVELIDAAVGEAALTRRVSVK